MTEISQVSTSNSVGWETPPIWSSFPQTSGLVIEQHMFTVYISLSAGIKRDLLCLHFYLQGSSGDSLCSNLSLKGSRDIYCVYNYLCRDQADNCCVHSSPYRDQKRFMVSTYLFTVIKPIFIVSKLFSTRIKRYWYRHTFFFTEIIPIYWITLFLNGQWYFLWCYTFSPFEHQ